MNLIASRFALIQLESKEAAHDGAKRAARFAAAALCAVFAWALLLAGGIAFISEQLGWSWSLVAIGTAILHLIAGIIFSRPPKGSGGEAFRVTRAEFQKDRAWIENLQNPKKSND